MKEKNYKKIYKKISKKFAEFDAEVAITAVENIEIILGALRKIIGSRTYSKEFYDDYLSRYDKDYRDMMPDARSLIIIAFPQKITEVDFSFKGRHIGSIMPPTYANRDEEIQVKAILEKILVSEGYNIKRIYILPEKLSAVLTGIGKYGRNNLCYCGSLGSFNTPMMFLSDMPAVNELTNKKSSFDEDLMMKSCKKCRKCLENCPTGAISEDSFVISPEKCITYFNENEPSPPGWALDKWQNTLVGCMKCQEVCPKNKKQLKEDFLKESFSEEETALILDNTGFKDLPARMQEKLKKLCLDDYYSILPRNLKMLFLS